MILVDTSVWIDFLRGTNSRECRMLHGLINEEEDIAITEILQGIKSEKDFQAVSSYMLEFPILKDKGTETYWDASNIYRICRKKGKTVRKTVDCVIAAVCVENDAIILDKDNDFDSVAACISLKVL